MLGSSSATHTYILACSDDSSGRMNFSSTMFSSKSTNFWLPVTTTSSYTIWML